MIPPFRLIIQSVALVMLLLTGHLAIAQINTPAGATTPFGSNTSYPGTYILPTNLPTGGAYGASQDAANAYNLWKSDYVVSCGGTSPEVFRRKFDTPAETVSEGIAYGMLLAAYAADKTLFDGLWQYYQDNMNGNGVMNWKIGGCSGTLGSGGATDAELDAAMALIVANHQWPNSSTPHDYAADATTLITTIKDYEIQPVGANGAYQTNNGDQWGFGNNCRNPSYQSPGYYKAYAQFVPAQAAFWNNCVVESYNLINANVHPTTGLVSNWSDHTGTPNDCNGPDEFGWDACRNPWRMGTDAAWYSDANALAICNNLSNYVQTTGATNLKGPVPQNGIGGDHHSSVFIGPWAVSVMGGGASYQSTLNSAYTETVAVLDGLPYYFGNTLRAISLFNLTGNFWLPTVGNIPPVASATATPVSGSGPLDVHFDGGMSSDADGDPLTYSWDFGDGDTDTGETVAHTYTTPGIYTAILTVDDGNGATDTYDIVITVIDPTPQPPTAFFEVTPAAGEYPLPVDFDASGSTDPNGDLLTYSWDFGDGSVMGAGEMPTHTYVTDGVYTVVLTVSDGTSTDTYTETVTVLDSPPIASFTATPQAGPAPLVVNVDAGDSDDPNGSTLVYNWDFGDGATASGETTSHTYTMDGVYTLTLTVTDENGNQDTEITTITVNSNGCSLRVYYRTTDNSITDATDNQVRPFFQIENLGTTAVDMEDITVRYYFKSEGITSQGVDIDWAAFGELNVVATVGILANPTPDADAYIEYGFKAEAGTLGASANSQDISTRFHKTDWSNHDETNDYSFNMTQSATAPWPQMTAYCNGVLSYGIEPSSALPIQLVAFNGQLTRTGVHELTWMTSREENSDYFDIERLTADGSFKTIGQVAAQGDSETDVNYRYLNEEVNGKVVYRLKMVDLDGSYDYSKLVVLDSGHSAWEVFPNPTQGVIQLRGVTSEGSYQLVSSAGKVVLNGRIGNLITNIDITQLPAGIYWLNISSSLGVKNMKVVKQ